MRSADSARRWIVVFAVSTVAAYSSALNAPFVFDDLGSVASNPSIRTLVPLTVPLHPPPFTSVTGRPVVNLSYALNYAVNDVLGIAQHPDPPSAHETTGYHAGNILIHLLGGLLLFGVLRRTLHAVNWEGRTFDADAFSAITTMLWLLHPIQTNAVDYITARTELVVSAFLLACLYAAIRSWSASSRASRAGWSVVAVLACACGMASKEVMVGTPLVVLLYDRAFRSSSLRAIAAHRAAVVLYAALFATCGIVVYTILTHARSASVGFDLGIPWYRYLYSQGWVVGRYLRLIAWPSGLLADYGERPISDWSALPGLVLLSAGAAGTLSAWRRPKWIWLAFLGSWFFIILAPSSSFVPIRTELGAEWRVYLPSAAIFVLAVLGLDRLFHRFAIRRRGTMVTLGCLLTVLAASTFVRGQTYASRRALYSDLLAKAPDNPRANYHAALVQFDTDVPDFEKAGALLSRSVALDSTYFDAWLYMGIVELAAEKPDAINAFGRAAAIRPGNTDAFDGIARALLKFGRPDSAAYYIDKLGVYDIELVWSVSAELIDRGRPASAIPFLERAVSAEPKPTGVALLAVAYAGSGRADDALKMAARAAASGDAAAETYALAAQAARVAGRSDLARTYVARALQIDSTSAPAKREFDALTHVRVR